VIERCLDVDPARRYATMADVDAALAAAQATPAVGVPPCRETGGAIDEQAHYRALARRLGDTLCRAAVAQPGGGMAWVSLHPTARGLLARDVNTGNAGTILALAELVAELGCAEHRRILAESAAWLAGSPSARSHAGLYIGESGVGAALLRAGQVLGDGRLLEAAAGLGRKVAAQPYACPDMFNGTAGRVRFQLLLWDELAAPENLDAAVHGGDALLTAAEDAGQGGVRWTIPPGYDSLSGTAYLGYAHGAAGIGDALLDLFEATSQRRFLDAARGAALWLIRLAMPSLDDGSGLDWPRAEGGALGGAFWCHGATGVGRFFAHAAQLDVLPEAAEVAARAARVVAQGARWVGPTQCHGLAGNVEFLLDMAQVTGNRAYRADAYALARLLEAFAGERDGGLMWPSESPLVVTPDYMVGYAGVAVCLLRLGAPDRLPYQLSRAGFRQAARPSSAVDGGRAVCVPLSGGR
jgi:lantibiotic modifying enzyme